MKGVWETTRGGHLGCGGLGVPTLQELEVLQIFFRLRAGRLPIIYIFGWENLNPVN
jgi:hypothetical protein